MKCLPFACLCLLWVPPTNVRADVVNGIDILSSVYSVDGRWSSTYYTVTNSQQTVSVSGNYGGSSSDGSPLAVQLTSAGPMGLPSMVNGSTSIDRFTFENHTGAAPGGGPFQYQGSDGVWYGFVGAEVNMQAQASWTFRPTTDIMRTTFSGSYRSGYGDSFSGLSVTLSDVTDSTVLLAFTENDMNNPYAPLNVTHTFSVSTSSTYQLTVHGWADTYDADYADEVVTASIVAIPEPGTCSLCLLGLLSLAGFKRWPLGHPRR